MTAPHILHTIILNWRTPALTLAAAEAALEAMEGIAGGITIVDNDSGDGSEAQLAAEAAARGWTAGGRLAVVGSGHNGGFGAGNNFAIRRGLPDGRQADLIYLLNSDAMPAPDAIRALIAHLDAHPEAGIACSRLHGPAGDHHDTAFRFPSIAGEFEATARTGPVTRWLARHVVALPRPQVSGRVDWSAGASMMIRQAVIDEIGDFDEGFFLYFEETDLCRRAAARGWQTHYVVESEVVHVGSASTGMKTWARVPDYWYASHDRYFRKHHGRRGALAAAMAHVAGGGLWRLRCLIERRAPGVPPGHLSRMARGAVARAVRPERKTP